MPCAMRTIEMDLLTNTDVDIMLSGYKASKHKNVSQGEYFNLWESITFHSNTIARDFKRNLQLITTELCQMYCVSTNEKELQIVDFLHVIW